ncbi:hypothetical protein F7725_021455 [Dissostichus mawsoni]|uniref:DUF4371 domain-containing protein n=1 Tax=Dissostichus mawsoni TaxID=36200 RepID=A0A7J5ZBG6_DISMA|nr:hypothetical protein F7725_021455 [Dissostichus mawsoni]
MNNPWATSGFIDLANLSRAIERHGKSKNPIDCAVKLKLFGRHKEQVKKNRDIMRKLIIAALYLPRQEQAFRGHNEAAGSSNRGNLVELARAFAELDTALAEHLGSSTVFSGMSNTGVDWDKNSALAFSVQTSPLHYQRTLHRSPLISRHLLSCILQRRVLFLDSS